MHNNGKSVNCVSDLLLIFCLSITKFSRSTTPKSPHHMVEPHFAPRVIKKMPRLLKIDNILRSIPTLLSEAMNTLSIIKASPSLYRSAQVVDGFKKAFSNWAYETRSLDLKYLSSSLVFSMALLQSLPYDMGLHFSPTTTTYSCNPNSVRWPCMLNHNSIVFSVFVILKTSC